MKPRCILALATQGAGGSDEDRLRALLAHLPTEFFPFDRQRRQRSFLRLLALLQRRAPELVVMEGTGIAGGLALLLARLCAGVPYVVSSGDAVGPFVSVQRPLLGPLFALYERLLCRLSAGFIGWTPYLTGRAIGFGAPRSMTAAGWAPPGRSTEQRDAARSRIRQRLGIPTDAIVFGLAGALRWTWKVGYCYGAELIHALTRSRRTDIWVLIVGDGNGRPFLERLAGQQHGQRVVLTGWLPREQVPDYLAAMDVASLPQSVDRLGSFRYTTKLSEYLAAGLPVITGQIPLAYDLAGDWLWRLPGKAPWQERYLRALAQVMTSIEPAELQTRRQAVPRTLPEFDRLRQVNRVTAFLSDLLKDRNDPASCP